MNASYLQGIACSVLDLWKSVLKNRDVIDFYFDFDLGLWKTDLKILQMVYMDAICSGSEATLEIVNLETVKP